MEVTWKLRPDAAWHDGAPLVAEDVVLGFRAGLDPDIGFLRGTRVLRLAREDPAYRLAQQRGLPNLAYDPSEAHRLLAASGWTRDPDRMYRSRDGKPFPIELMAQQDVGTRVQIVLAITNMWKQAGIEAKPQFISGSGDWRPPAANAQGVYIRRQVFASDAFSNFVTREIAAEANRWRGSNRGGYSNPTYDQLYERFWTTIESSQRNQIAAEMAKMLLDEMAYLPTIFNSEVAAVGKGVGGVTGVIPGFRVTTWNVQLWDMV